MSKLLPIAVLLSLLLQCIYPNTAASSIYKSYTSDIVKGFHPATAAGTTTAAILPNRLKSFAGASSAVSSALAHTHLPQHTPCKKHHSAHYPHFFIPAPAAHYYRHLYAATAPVSVPVHLPATPTTVYVLSTPSALSNYMETPLSGYVDAATRPVVYPASAAAATSAASASNYDHHHFYATSTAAAAVKPPLPYAAYAPSSSYYDFASAFAWQQALLGNSAK